ASRAARLAQGRIPCGSVRKLKSAEAVADLRGRAHVAERAVLLARSRADETSTCAAPQDRLCSDSGAGRASPLRPGKYFAIQGYRPANRLFEHCAQGRTADSARNRRSIDETVRTDPSLEAQGQVAVPRGACSTSRRARPRCPPGGLQWLEPACGQADQ